jgi:hypothetical protein
MRGGSHHESERVEEGGNGQDVESAGGDNETHNPLASGGGGDGKQTHSPDDGHASTMNMTATQPNDNGEVDDSQRRKRSRRRWIIGTVVLLCIAVAAAVLGGVFGTRRRQENLSDGDANSDEVKRRSGSATTSSVASSTLDTAGIPYRNQHSPCVRPMPPCLSSSRVQKRPLMSVMSRRYTILNYKCIYRVSDDFMYGYPQNEKNCYSRRVE